MFIYILVYMYKQYVHEEFIYLYLYLMYFICNLLNEKLFI